MFQAIDSLALSTVTGGGKKDQPAPQPSYPNCYAFCGTNVTGVKTGPISVDDHSRKKTTETTNGVKASATFPAIGAASGNVE